MSESGDWDHPKWLVKSDTALRRRLRRHQAWWRATTTEFGPGPRSRSDDRLVVSMLPTFGSLEPNLMSQAACKAAEEVCARLSAKGGPGLVQRDRLERNLLSSQPLCFNLFGHFREQPEALLPWVRSVRDQAKRVTRVDLEIAPVKTPLGGSAFDAYVEYELDGRRRGFLGIECKYAEDLSSAQPKQAAQKYHSATTSPPWLKGAAESLDRPRLRQFWYNTLLVQLTRSEGDFAEATSVVVALDQDNSAREVTEQVRGQLMDRSEMTFCSLQDVVSTVTEGESWKQAFGRRYLDLQLSE